MRTLTALSLAFLLILSACNSSKPDDPYVPPIPDPDVVLESAKLYIFSAPWCHPCHELHQEFIAAVEAEPELLKKVEVTTWVTTGANSSQPPTEAIAKQYKDKLAAPYTFLPDPWKWTNFKKYLGGSLAIPGAVVLDDSGEVVQKFPPGQCSASGLLKYLRSLLGIA